MIIMMGSVGLEPTTVDFPRLANQQVTADPCSVHVKLRAHYFLLNL